MTRPDYIACIRLGYGDARGERSWCGRTVATFRPDRQGTFDALEFHFTGLDHAALNAVNGGRLVPCPACVDAAVAALRSQETP